MAFVEVNAVVRKNPPRWRAASLASSLSPSRSRPLSPVPSAGLWDADTMIPAANSPSPARNASGVIMSITWGISWPAGATTPANAAQSTMPSTTPPIAVHINQRFCS